MSITSCTWRCSKNAASGMGSRWIGHAQPPIPTSPAPRDQLPGHAQQDPRDWGSGRTGGEKYNHAQAPFCLAAPLFVVQKHAARTLHYDFRLEREGVFKSWAVLEGRALESDPVKSGWQSKLRITRWNSSIPRAKSRRAEYGAGRIEMWDRGNSTILGTGKKTTSCSACTASGTRDAFESSVSPAAAQELGC